MKYVLARGNREILERFAWSKVMLALDYDGTLAPIVRDPFRARMRSRTHELLKHVAYLYPCVIISGRARRDILRFLRGIKARKVVGSHGMDLFKSSERYRGEVRRWRRCLEKLLAGQQGVWIEDKRFSLSIHYRRSRRKKDAVAAIRRALRDLDGFRLIGGKQVMNLLPDGAPHKGLAIEKLRGRLHCDTAIYLGDDQNDEDVFALEQPGWLLAIRVGMWRHSRASYFIKNQKEIDRVLRLLLKFRKAADIRARNVECCR